MNDKIIIKIITKIHLKLLFFFSFLFLITFLGFVLLIEGFTISHLKLGDIVLEKVYLKWDNRLHIKASLIDLSALKSDDKPITLKSLQHFPKTIKHAEKWIASVDIEAIRYQHVSVSLHYFKNKQGTISVRNGNTTLDGKFTLTPKILHLTLSSPKESLNRIRGDLLLDIAQQSFAFNASLALPNSPIIRGFMRGNQTTLFLKFSADKSFKKLDELIDFIPLDPDIRPWIVQYAQFQSATLQSCEGKFLYDEPKNLLESLKVHATATKAQYTFDPMIAPIKADNVDVYFQKGKLHIIPHNGIFYTLPIQKSRLTIDFTTPHAMLNAHIVSSQGKLNDDILYLLNHYKINVPVRQNRGITNVDLNLSINLHTLNTTAKGQFIPSASEIELDGFVFKTLGGKVELDGANVNFYGFDARYKNLASAKVAGDFDASKGIGKVQIDPYFFNPTGDATELSLVSPSNAPHITYRIHPSQDTIEISPSLWHFFDEPLYLDRIKIPFNFKEHHAFIPKLVFSIPNKLSGNISGEVSAADWSLNLHLDKVDISGLNLIKAPFNLHITPKNNDILFTSPLPSFWKLGGQSISFSSFSILDAKDSLIFDNIHMYLKDQFNANLSGDYQKKTQQGSLQLQDINAINPRIARYLDINSTQSFSLDASKPELLFHSQSLGITLSSTDTGWKMEIPDISLLSKSSPLLSSYAINHGNAIFYYSPADKRVTFNGVIEYPYRLMMVNGKSLSTYRFSGSHTNGKTFLRVNDRLNITDENVITVRANNMGVNGRELLRWLSLDKKIDPKHTSAKELKPIHLNATNIVLYLMENRKILADSLHAKMSANDLDGRLTHKNGSADITMKDSLFYVEGRGFNDHFMENLFAFSDFEGGNLSFKISGKAEEFEGVMRIDEAILKEYKMLNNILSFINTIPSLTTFSLPNYNQKGLFVKDTYAHFTYQNHLFTIDNYTLNSSELKIAGNAQANILEDKLNGTLTLKTDLGSALGKVPMVGYILLGDDGSISTTLNLKGKLSDPVVETGIAKEIVTAPFNILKRTVSYPFLWMMDDEKKK